MGETIGNFPSALGAGFAANSASKRSRTGSSRCANSVWSGVILSWISLTAAACLDFSAGVATMFSFRSRPLKIAVCEAVVVAGWNRIEFMIVASCATDRQTEESPSPRADDIFVAARPEAKVSIIRSSSTG